MINVSAVLVVCTCAAQCCGESASQTIRTFRFQREVVHHDTRPSCGNLANWDKIDTGTETISDELLSRQLIYLAYEILQYGSIAKETNV